MEIWIIQAQENPAAPRNEHGRREWRANTLSEVLSDSGYQVTRWRSSFSHQAKKQLTNGSNRLAHDNYHHQFIQSPDYKRHIGLARILNHRALGRNFTKIAEKYDRFPSVIHTANVPIELCYAAVKFGYERNIPVVIDVRDLWPDIYLDVIPETLSFLRPLGQFFLDVTSQKLKYAFSKATAITALTQSYLDWGLEKANRSQYERDAIFPMCYPSVESKPAMDSVSKIRNQLGLSKNDILACYFGNIGYQSDFDGVVEAGRILKDSIPSLKFIIAGSGPREEEIRRMSIDLPNVIVPGWLQGGEVQMLMSISTFGLVIYNSVSNYLRNIPNKYSEYLAGGQVIACGLMGEMGTLTKKAQCGFVYEAGNPESLAKELSTLINQPDDLKAMSKAALNLHKRHFDGSKLYENFADYLTAIATKQKGKV